MRLLYIPVIFLVFSSFINYSYAIVKPTVGTVTTNAYYDYKASISIELNNDGGETSSIGYVISNDSYFVDNHVSSTTMVTGSSGSVTGAYILGLTASTTYYIKGYAENSAGVSYSNIVTVATPRTYKPFLVASETDSIGKNSINLNANLFSNSGRYWKEQDDFEGDEGDWYTLVSSADGMKLARMTIGSLLTSNDGGNTWILSDDYDKYWISIDMSADGTKLIAAEVMGYIYTSTDSGATWIQQINSGQKTWSKVAISDNGLIMFAIDTDTSCYDSCQPGSIYKSIDGGVNWILDPIGSDPFIDLDISGDGNTVIIPIAESALALLSTNSGTNWSVVNMALYGPASWLLSSAVSSSGQYIVLGGIYGDGIYYSDDYGDNWNFREGYPLNFTTTENDWISLDISDDGNTILAMSQNGAYNSFDAGLTFERSSLTTDPGKVWKDGAMSSDGSIFYSLAGWSHVFNSVDYTDPITVGFAYGLTDAYGATTSQSSSISSGNFNYSLTGLSCSTTYHYKPYAQSISATGYDFNDNTFTTADCSVPALSIDSASSVSNNSITANATISDTGGFDITSRGFNYGLTTEYSSTTTDSGTYSSGAFSASLSSLTCGTTYHIRSYAVNSLGINYSSDSTFNTSSCSSSSGGGGGGSSGSTYSGGGTGYYYTYIPSLPLISLPKFNIKKPIVKNVNTKIIKIVSDNTDSTSLRLKNNLNISNNPIVNTYVYKGQSNTQIQDLQRFLNKSGFIVSNSGAGSPGKETMYFRDRTFIALRKYQLSVGLPANGIFGPLTREMMGL